MRRDIDEVLERMATQRKVLRPSDNPVIYGQSVGIDAEKDLAGQFQKTITQGKTLSTIYGTTLESIGEHINTARRLAVDYSSMDEALKNTAVTQIEGVIEQMVILANTRFGNNYVFGWKDSRQAPFSLASDYSVGFRVPASLDTATEVFYSKGGKAKLNIPGRDVFVDKAKVILENPGNTYTGKALTNGDSFAYVVDASNNGIVVNGTALTLDAGTYNGGRLAEQIGAKLGTDYKVAYDSFARKFSITNQSGSPVTFSWTSPAATARGLLGFSSTDITIDNGKTDVSDYDTGAKSFLVNITYAGSTGGALADRARYRYSTDGGTTWSGEITVTTGGSDSVADLTIDATNRTFYVKGAPVNITAGTYTGQDLATEVQTQLGAGYTVAYDGTSRKFSITNNTGGVVTFNWSNPGSTSAGILGFDTVDSVLDDGVSESGDFQAGGFIDGTGIATRENNLIKLAFESNTVLSAGDRFTVGDLNVFDLLSNFRDAIENKNDAWVEKYAPYLDKSLSLIKENGARVAINTVKAEGFIDDNNQRLENLKKTYAELMNADLADLATEYNMLSTSYQAILSMTARIQNLSILNYL